MLSHVNLSAYCAVNATASGGVILNGSAFSLPPPCVICCLDACLLQDACFLPLFSAHLTLASRPLPPRLILTPIALLQSGAKRPRTVDPVPLQRKARGFWWEDQVPLMSDFDFKSYMRLPRAVFAKVIEGIKDDPLFAIPANVGSRAVRIASLLRALTLLRFSGPLLASRPFLAFHTCHTPPLRSL